MLLCLSQPGSSPESFGRRAANPTAAFRATSRRRRCVTRPASLVAVKMKPIWIWAQAIIVIGTLAGMIIAITKLA